MLPLRLQGLQAAGMTRCIDLTGDRDPVPPYQPLPVGGRAARREVFAIADFGVPSAQEMRRVLDTIAQALDDGESVYLHCRAGIGRTGTVAGCLLVEQGFNGDEALAIVQRKYNVMIKSALARHSPETGEQRSFIARWRAGAGAS
ncbi:MAG: dual specificity protein phosphatase family protein [Rubrivivax sp.]|nr:dual specificity protein phosphatase family protein [Rubrivivax sp.]